MVKRILALGAAMTLILSMSVVGFAAGTASGDSIVSLDFPFYGHLRVRQGNGNSPVELYLGTDGVPVSSDSAYGLSGGEGVNTKGTIIFDFYPRSGKYTPNNAESLTWKTQAGYLDIDLNRYDRMEVHYKSNGEIDYIDSPITDANPMISTEISTITTPKSSDIYCKTVMGGSYLLEGVLEFPSGSVTNADAWKTMISGVSGTIITSQGNFAMSIPFASYDVKHINNKDRVNFKFSLGVPYSGEYQRMFFQFNSVGESIPQLSGFSINTGSLKINDINSISGLGYSLAGWFQEVINSIKSGFYTQNLDAGAAAQNSDQQSVDTAQSQVTAVEQFESATTDSINNGITIINNSGYLSVPNYTDSSGQGYNSGMGAALAAIGWVFAQFFGKLGGYQVVITVPLCLGIMLLLVGRGTIALGRILSMNARMTRSEGGEGE